MTLDLPENIVVIHRWVGRTADYPAYVDHAARRVSYVVPPSGRHSYPAAQAHDVEYISTSGRAVATEDDLAAYADALERLAARNGPVTRLIALHEGDLMAAAELRRRLGLPGMLSEDTEQFRDKLVMAQRLAGSSVTVPATATVHSAEDLLAFGADHGWPVFLKPRSGSQSSDTTKLDSAAAVASFTFPHGVELIAQPFVDGKVIHVDGFWTGDALRKWSASEYQNTCFEFESGLVLGSVEIDDPAALSLIESGTESVLRALTGKPTVFHLEMFTSDGPVPELTFLEIAGRAGGGDIPYVWRTVHGTDLIGIAFAIQAGQDPATIPVGPPATDVGGWLMIPPPGRQDGITTRVGSQLHRDGVFAEVLPSLDGTTADIGGYENTGGRFRFRGPDSATLRRIHAEITADIRFETAPPDGDTLIVLGSGAHLYREYGFRAIAGRARVILLDPAELTWQREWVDEYHHLDPTDPAAGLALATRLIAAAPAAVAVLTWDETLVELTARITAENGLPGMSVEAVAHCRDKNATRTLLAAAGVSPVESTLTTGVGQAAEVAARIGYPIVVKPRSQGASVGVVRVDHPDALAAGYEHARVAFVPGLQRAPGVLVEEYLDGAEISIDSVVRNGRVDCVNVARKRLGPAPYFEEVGHLVQPWAEETWWPETEAMVHAAHRVLGVTHGVTHAEVKLTGRGPRLVELNCRLGGDLIPYLGLVANGLDLVAAAVDIAFDRSPAIAHRGQGWAEVAFVCPEVDCVIGGIEVAGARDVPGVTDVHVLVRPGREVRLPPRGILPRVVAVVVSAVGATECRAAIEQALDHVVITSSPITVLDLVSS